MLIIIIIFPKGILKYALTLYLSYIIIIIIFELVYLILLKNVRFFDYGKIEGMLMFYSHKIIRIYK